MVIEYSALLVMDVHAHLSKTEVIGLLGGEYSSEEGELHVTTAQPCDSISTGMQCEMDPGEALCLGSCRKKVNESLHFAPSLNVNLEFVNLLM